ncbi:pyrin and HIN domain-containing protein 1 isoform X2 [Pan troglodytes]|uniref:pyrin and HIN domain-containing protein 1 isoform X2 n=1 Tax=Pan troglodytes TaxID=9598 RepID=UPI0023F0C869|nr:pyrin and HIN domain-containing protein 1 isoform X1 [Pan troglodytes]
MANNYKKIVLLKGLEVINDYHFRIVKSLLSNDLKLNPKMKEEYDKIQIADLMEEKFPGDAGLGKLIEFFKEIPTLGDLAETLKREKLKVKGIIPSKKTKQKEVDPATPASTPSNRLTAKGAEETLGPQSLKPLANRQATASKNIFREDPIIAMVLNATKIFKYESSENEQRRMFHATVATQTQFFHVKVLNINLKRKFIKKRIIIISNYSKRNSLLEVNEASSVSEAGPDQTFEVPKDIIRRAKKIPKINILHKQTSGYIVYGLFMLHMKIVNRKMTIYEIQDKTGSMAVVGKGECHNIPCEKGDKLRLFCFRLRKRENMSKLMSEMHSFIQIQKNTNQRSHDSRSMALPQEQSQHPKPSEASTTLPESHLKTPQMPPTTPSSSSFTKVQYPGSHASYLPNINYKDH